VTDAAPDRSVPERLLPGVAPGVGAALLAVLREAAALGFLGPGPVEPHVTHALRFDGVLRPTAALLDLGSGGGVPGLILASVRPTVEVVLLDARTQRTDFLARAIGRLGWSERVTVLAGRAEALGRSPAWRGRFGAVVARSFGSPAETAECGAPFLAAGGQLVVSEPPDPAADRWPVDGLGLVGLRADEIGAGGLASFTQVEPCPDRFPRRRRRPSLFELGST
jgi:16S rRNA (guanine527-N7)-methyltransferase